MIQFNRTMSLTLLWLLCVAVPRAGWASPELALSGDVIGHARTLPLAHETIEFPRPRPREPLVYNWQQIEQARARTQATEWGRSFLRSVTGTKNSFVMTMSEEEVARYLDPRVGFFLPRDPISRTNTSYMPHYWEFSTSDPETYRSLSSDFVWPNDAFPLEHVQKIMSPRGNIHEYRYWEDEEGVRYYFDAWLRKQVQGSMLWQFRNMAMAYLLTGEEEYARRVAVMLYRLSQVYPEWLPHGPGETYGVAGPRGYNEYFFSADPPFPYVSGRSREWYIGDSWLLYNTAVAYDLIYASGELEKLSSEVGEDVRARIERDLLYEIAAFVREFMPDMHNPNGINARAMAALGLVMQDPGMVRVAMEQFEPILHSGTNLDGFWHEGTYAYHLMVLSGMIDLPEILMNYSDPPGYMDERGRRFDRLDLYQAYPELASYYSIPRRLFLPNGYVLALNDTSVHYKVGDTHEADERRFVNYGGHYAEPRATEYSVFQRPEQTIHDGRAPEEPEWQSLLYPASGYAFIRGLSGDNAAQVFFETSEFSGHHHRDLLHIALFAKGFDISPDLGYTYTRERPFADSTAGHNTVVVNARGQTMEHGELHAAVLATNDEDTRRAVQYISARAPAAYEPEGVDVYERELAFIPVGEEDFYLFDLFRVRGGQVHDWLLHGTADFPQQLVADLAFEPVEGNFSDYSGGNVPTTSMEAGHDYFRRTDADREELAEFMEIVRQESGLDFVKEIERADAPTHFSFAFEFKKPVETPRWGRSWSSVAPFPAEYALPLREEVVMRTHLLSGGEMTFHRATAPGLRRAAERDELLAEARMPIAIVRRQAEEDATHFLAIHEIHDGKPFIGEVRQLVLDESQGRVAVAIGVEGGWDVLLSTRRGDGEVTAQHEGMEFALTGRFGIVRLRNGGVEEALLVEGTELRAGDWTVRAPAAALHGTLTGQDDRGLRTEATLTTSIDAAGYDLPRGTILHVDHQHGQRISLPMRDAQIDEDSTTFRLLDVYRLNSGEGEVADVIPGQGIRSTIQQARAFYGEGFVGQRLIIGHEEFTISHTHIGWEIDVEETDRLSGITKGDRFQIRAFRDGDDVRIPIHVRVRLDDSGEANVSGILRKDWTYVVNGDAQ